MTTVSTRRSRAAGILAAPFLTLALLAAWLVVAATPAHADTASITVSKATDLNPAGETLTVSGKGFIPGVQLFVVVCDPAQPAGKACDMANFKMASVDAGGGFVAEIKAAAKFGGTDCTAIPCAVQTSRVGNGKDRTQEALAAIGFTGGVAPSLPAKPQENAGGPGSMPPAPGGTPPTAAPSAGGDLGPGAESVPPQPGASLPDRSASKDDSSDSSHTGVIVTIFVVVGVLVIGAGAYAFAKRRKNQA
ncbi:neocarzinostatin apoprotein domain-containing protein [Yinghuangia seranimata]|uniref:neocarzinostatin apoprotein domain-containing protein n=1 Tax=Yinghuangia seranimata TaxID=408067 RepID=UPI00248ACB2B|nr:neocarzinostatin apoprotein domain-containing protein [Yinghuangia seranimata]MDI2125272.1 neocarzinostatin apoprotein domain-containing protein [Yinghuangia seranimata]